jgi:hypothetical protein
VPAKEKRQVLDKYWNRYTRVWAVAHAVNNRVAELQADAARAEYERALLAARDNTHHPAELFRIASKHPLAFDVWMRDLDDWDKLELIRRLMQGAPYRVPSC